MKTILDEAQLERDMELSKIMKVPLLTVKFLKIGSPESIIIFKPQTAYPLNYEQYKSLYTDYPHLDFIAYAKTLMYTSVNKRGKNLRNNLNIAKGNCLDFGSGVGTHSIYMLQNNCKVWTLDVPGKLLDFTLRRIKYRDMYNNFGAVMVSSTILHENFFNYVNCLDVLEHCYDPHEEINRIYKCLKKDGILHLQVSEMVKPSSGHFKESIDKWKFYGKDFMKNNFYQEGKNLYRKI